MTLADDVVVNNQRYAVTFRAKDHTPRPKRQLTVVACMDSRLDVLQVLGLEQGDAHILRNAGGVVTDDVIRSLIVSQRKLGTREVFVVLHTDCGMLTFTDDELRRELEMETGMRPHFTFEAFKDVEVEVSQCVSRIRNSLFIPHRDAVRGFVFDVKTGRLTEVA